MTPKSKSKLALGLASIAALGGILALGTAGGSPAGADPAQYSQTNLVGVGSDTTEQVMSAMTGRAGPTSYLPVRTAGGVQLLSFDATQDGTIDTCIETRTSAPSIYRPNGSSEGRRALSRAFGGGTYGIASCGIKSVGGLIDFARSSSGPGSTTTPAQLVYIPFARDALSIGYYNVSGTATTNLSRTTLTSLFSTGPQVINGKLIVPCGIQNGSGTFQSWNSMLQINTTQEGTGTAFCNGLAGVPNADGRVQENKTDQLKTKGDILQTTSDPICDGVAGGPAVSCAGGQVIAGFSASAYIASGNGKSSIPFEPAVLLGSIDALPLPVSGTAPNLSAVAGFYNSGTFGRDVYNVLPKVTVDDLFNDAVQSMFVGPSSLVCQQTATIQAFGYLTLGTGCGSTTLTGPYLSGQK